MLYKPTTSPLVGYIVPQLATLVDVPPDAAGWIQEIKHGGYHVDGQRSRAFTRNGHDWTAKYQPVVDATREIDCRSAVIDGEIIVVLGAARMERPASRGRACDGRRLMTGGPPSQNL